MFPYWDPVLGKYSKTGKMFQCAGCKVFAHLHCLYEDNYKPRDGERMLCEICFDLENHPPDRKSPTEGAESALTESAPHSKPNKGGRPPKQPRRDDDSDTEDSSDEEDDANDAKIQVKNPPSKKLKLSNGSASVPSSSSSSKSAGGAAKSAIRKKVGLGDVVRARGVEGTVVWIDSSECRIHTPGTSRQEDVIVDFLSEEVQMLRRAAPGSHGDGLKASGKSAVPVGRRRSK